MAGDGPDRDAVLRAIRRGEGNFGKREIARLLKLKGDERIGLKRVLSALESEGVIQRTARRTYAVADASPGVRLVEIVDRDTDGELLARPEKSGPGDPLIRMAPGQGASGRAGGALGVGERALVKIERDQDGEPVARLIKRLGQSAHRILCVYRADGSRPRLVPVDRRSKNELIPSKDSPLSPKNGDLVICELAKDRQHGLKSGRIIEVVGNENEARASSVISLAAHGVPEGFNDNEIEQAEKAKPATVRNREDLRHLPLVTIDPEDARDFDDAVLAEPDEDPKNKNGWVVWVAIADVAHYVTPNSPLDRGALKRGNSVYMPDRVVPMLPERLSNDLCSLRPDEDRACMAARMVFNASGDKIGHSFHRGLMRSSARLTYAQAQAAFEGNPGPEAADVVTSTLQPLWKAYQAVKAARQRRSPLEIDSPERKVRVDEQGNVVSITRYERFAAHMLIEEFMIQANVCAAETLEQKRLPLIYRVHDEPSREKLTALADYLPQVGMKWSMSGPVKPERFNQLLSQARNCDYEEVVNEVVLRSQSQAIYSTENLGHFGLNLQRYAHFTSPIRRYADLTVHRGLIKACKLGDDGQTNEEASKLSGIAEDITHTERRAMAAERDSVDRYIASFLSDRVGSEFQGRITGVTRFGAFVRLAETGADGLVPVSSLGDDYFHHDEKAHALIGRRTGGRFELGQNVTVRLKEAAPITGGLILEILDKPKRGRPSGSGRGEPPRRGGGSPGRSGGGGAGRKFDRKPRGKGKGGKLGRGGPRKGK